MNEFNRKPAYTVTELASARQHQKNWPTIMERAVEGGQAAYPEFGFSAGGRGADFGLTAPRGRGGGARFITPICCCMRANSNIDCPVAPGGKGERVGIGGGGRGGWSGVAHKQQWMVHPLCLQHTDRTRARAAAARLGDRRRRCESSFRALARTRRAGSGDAFMLRGRVHSR